MKQLSISVLALFLLACNSMPAPTPVATKDTLPTTTTTPPPATAKADFTDAASAKAYIEQLHKDLEKAAFDEGDSVAKLEAINRDLHTAWQNIVRLNLWKDASINVNDINKSTSTYLISEDKKFALITWNSQLGGTMVFMQGIAIFETANGVQTEKLFVSEEEGGDMGVGFKEIYTMTNPSGVKTYFAYGVSKLSSLMALYVLEGFQIGDGLIKDIALVKGEQGGIAKVYDFKDAGDITVSGFTFSADKKQITVPLTNAEDIPTGKNAVYVFDGNVYVKK